MDSRAEITGLLIAFQDGDGSALGELFERVYNELRRLAHGRIGRGPSRPIDTTALVHEVYVRLVDPGRVGIRDRHHFFAVAATAMRQIVVDHARAATARKRGGDVEHVPLDDDEARPDGPAPTELLALDEALARLRALSPRLCRVVELRYFLGLSIEETAVVLEVTERTVKRDWSKARALLLDDLRGDSR